MHAELLSTYTSIPLQTYTDSADNVKVADGNLYITALQVTCLAGGTAWLAAACHLPSLASLLAQIALMKPLSHPLCICIVIESHFQPLNPHCPGPCLCRTATGATHQDASTPRHTQVSIRACSCKTAPLSPLCMWKHACSCRHRAKASGLPSGCFPWIQHMANGLPVERCDGLQGVGLPGAELACRCHLQPRAAQSAMHSQQSELFPLSSFLAVDPALPMLSLAVDRCDGISQRND
jgi:hypothetical protein